MEVTKDQRLQPNLVEYMGKRSLSKFSVQRVIYILGWNLGLKSVDYIRRGTQF